jgi:hypothetical protein
MVSKNKLNMAPLPTRPTQEQMTAELLASGQPIQPMQPQQPSPVDNIIEGLGQGAKGLLQGFGDFVNAQKDTPEGRLLLNNMLAGVTVALGADPAIGANIVQQGQEQFKLGLAKQEKESEREFELKKLGLKQDAEALKSQRDRDQKLIDEQRQRQGRIEDALFLDAKKKEQDPTQARFNARTEASHTILSEFESGKNPYYLNTQKFLKDQNVPYMFKSDEYKQIEQAQRDFINATLRRESGAAIAPSEFENAQLQYFPQPGDTPEVVKQKQRNREMQFAKIEALQKNIETLTDGYEILKVRKQ